MIGAGLPNPSRAPVLSLMLACSLTACGLPLAYPPTMDSAWRSQIKPSTGDSIQSGTTTRVDVLLKFGEPDGRGVDDRWFTYVSSSVWGIGAMGNGAPVGHQGIDTRRMTVWFDPNGVVTKVEFQQRNCSRPGDFWEAHPPPCLDPGGADLPRR